MVTSAGRYNLRVNQGATFSLLITWKDSLDNPTDLSGASAELRMSTKHQGLDGVVVTPRFLFSTDPAAEDGEITLGGALGTILLEATDEQTDTFDWGEIDATYDLYITLSNGQVVRLLDGTVLLSKKQA